MEEELHKKAGCGGWARYHQTPEIIDQANAKAGSSDRKTWGQRQRQECGLDPGGGSTMASFF